MQCAEFETRLQYLLDRRRSPEQDRPLQTHASMCSRCRETLLLQEQLLDCLEWAVLPEPRASFAERTVERAVSQQRRWGAYQLATAAALLLLALLPFWWQGKVDSAAPQVADTRAHEVNVPTAAPTAPSPTIEDAPAIADSLPDRSRATVEVTASVDRLRSADAEMQRVVERVTSQLMIVNVNQLGRFQPVEPISGGLRPIADTFGAAFDALRRTWPAGQESQPESASPDAAWRGGRAPWA